MFEGYYDLFYVFCLVQKFTYLIVCCYSVYRSFILIPSLILISILVLDGQRGRSLESKSTEDPLLRYPDSLDPSTSILKEDGWGVFRSSRPPHGRGTFLPIFVTPVMCLSLISSDRRNCIRGPVPLQNFTIGGMPIPFVGDRGSALWYFIHTEGRDK